jgi:hypothetical protein
MGNQRLALAFHLRPKDAKRGRWQGEAAAFAKAADSAALPPVEGPHLNFSKNVAPKRFLQHNDTTISWESN